MISWTRSRITEQKEITQAERESRRLLCSIMAASGFKAFKYEWWHYSLADEPHPHTYFDFPIA